MSKAIEKAYEAYPLNEENRLNHGWNAKRVGFQQGYEKAEKDFELTWEDIANILDITDIIANDDSMEERLKTMSEEEYCQEVLKRFKAQKGEKV